jgi:integrase
MVEALAPNRLVFTTERGHPVQHSNFYRRVFRPAVERLWPQGQRLHGLRWHDLRHTCASLSLAATGGNLHVVKERLGHSSITVTVDRYGKLLPSVDEALAEALAAMYDASEDNVVELRPAEDG